MERDKTKTTHEGSCLEKEENKGNLWGRSHQLEGVGEWSRSELQKACMALRGSVRGNQMNNSVSEQH